MATTIITREGKGIPLTNAEVDANFTNLRDAVDAKMPLSEKGAVNGVAPLDSSGKVPLTNLPALGPSSTDSLSEGTTNLYHTTVRAAAAAPVQSVNGKTGAFALNAADVGAASSAHVGAGGAAHSNATTSTAGFMSNTDKTKLDSVATNAAALGSAAGAALAASGAAGSATTASKSDHVHPYPTAAQVGAAPAAHVGTGGAAHADATTTTSGFFTGAEKQKLTGIAAGATANATDAQLRDRATHTGTQAISTVSGLQTELDSKAAVGSVAGANLGVASAGSAATASRSDHVHKLPTAAEVGAAPAAHASATDNPHNVTAAQVGAAPSAHVGAGGTAHANATTSVDGFMSAADKTKLNGVASGATANATDAQLRDRSTHTGTQAQSTVTNLTTDLAARVNRQDTYATVTSGVINLGLETELYHITVSGNVTVSVSNAPTTSRVVKRLIVQYSSGVVAWPGSFKLPTPMPTFSAGKAYVFSIEQSPNSGVYFLVPGPEYTYP